MGKRNESMSQVFVLDTNKQPLAPLHAGRARLLLTQGKAAVYRRYPFTLILKTPVMPNACPPLRVKVDPGSKTSGLALVNDASFFEVKRQLLYKAQQYGGSVQMVDRWFPSSKTCHRSGLVKQDVTLADHVWVCEQCGIVHDRDWNAAIMVETEALRLIRDVPVVASSGHKFARRERNALARTTSEPVCCEAGTTVL
jgi:RRXRR protein/Putative transposase DNA-binding domain